MYIDSLMMNVKRNDNRPYKEFHNHKRFVTWTVLYLTKECHTTRSIDHTERKSPTLMKVK